MAVGKITEMTLLFASVIFCCTFVPDLQQPAAEVYQRMKRVNLSERVFILEPTINFGG